MNIIRDIITFVSAKYIVGSEECIKAFNIFNLIGYTLCCLAGAYLFYVFRNEEKIEANIIASNKINHSRDTIINERNITNDG